jgi:hypothetical protein
VFSVAHAFADCPEDRIRLFAELPLDARLERRQLTFSDGTDPLFSTAASGDALTGEPSSHQEGRTNICFGQDQEGIPSFPDGLP